MKHLLACIAIAAGVAGPTMAADLAPKAPAYKAPPPVRAVSWTGFYAGVNAGYAWTDSDWQMSTPTAVVTFRSGTLHPQGFIGGGQAGFNWQSGFWVWGIEADIDGRGGSDLVSIPGAGGATGGFRILDSHPKWLATVRPRVGAAFDNILLYATGGLAVGEVRVNHTLLDPPGGSTSVFSTSSTRSGWTVGAGLEYAVARPWSVKLEYLYVDLGTTTLATPADAFFVPASTTVSNKSQIVRAGLNYRFN